MKKRIIASAVLAALTFSVGSAHAQGIPTIDASSIFQLQEQLKQLREQVATARSQLDEARRMYDSVTGIRGLGNVLRNSELRKYLPDDMTAIYDTANRGGLDGIQGGIDEILRNERWGNDVEPATAQEQVLEREREAAAVAKAQGQKAYEGAQKRLDQIEGLMDEISKTRDQKAIDELQARIAGEQAAIQNEVQKIALVQQLHDAEQRLVEVQKDEAVRKEFDASRAGMPGIRR